MACAGLSCRQGRSKCETPWTCGGYATEAHHAAMTAPVGSFYPRDKAAEQADPPRWPSRVTLIALFCAAWAALGLPWLYLNWARVVAALGAL